MQCNNPSVSRIGTAFVFLLLRVDLDNHTYKEVHCLACSFYIGDLAKLKDSPITIKEGCEYRVKIVFRVQRDIVSGLRYAQNTYRKGIKGWKVFYLKPIYVSQPLSPLQLIRVT